MTDIVELNAGGFPVKNASYWKRQYDSVCKQLAECQAHAKNLETSSGVSLGELSCIKQLAKYQAREKVLRDALSQAAEDMEGWGSYAGEYFQEKWDLNGDIEKLTKLDAMPSDSTALDTMLKQAKREALLDAATEFEEINPTAEIARCSVGDELRRMAEELK